MVESLYGGVTLTSLETEQQRMSMTDRQYKMLEQNKNLFQQIMNDISGKSKVELTAPKPLFLNASTFGTNKSSNRGSLENKMPRADLNYP